MKRHMFSLSFLFSFLLVQPLAAFAAPFDAGSLLKLATDDTAPMEFQITGSNAGTTVVWNGLQEGKGSEWYKLKGVLKITHSSDNKEMVSMFRVMVHEGMMYVSPQEITATTNKGTKSVNINEVKGKWASWSFDGQDPGSAMDNAFGTLIGSNGMSFIGEAWGRIFDKPESLAMTENRFQNGHAYSLTLMHSNENESLHVKIDTDKAFEFLHMKFYDAIGSNAIEGKMQHSGKPVYLEIPPVTIDVDDLMGMMMGNATSQQTTMRTQSSTPSSTSHATPYKSVISDNSRPTSITRYEIMPSILTMPDDGMPFTPSLFQFTKSQAYRNGQYAPTTLWQPALHSQGNKYERLTAEFMDLAMRNEVYTITSLLSRDMIMENGAETVQKWLSEDILPFFGTIDLQSAPEVLGIYRAEDPTTGKNGIAVHESFLTKAGAVKSFIVFIVQEKGYHSVIQAIYTNASPRDLGILEGKIQARTNLEEFITPLNGIQVAFDNRDWTLAYNTETDGQGIAKFVLPGQTIESWNEIFTVRYMNTDKSIATVTKEFAMQAAELCSNVEFTTISKSTNNIKAELHTDCAPYIAQHEIMRFFRSGSTVYQLSYTENTEEMGSGMRTVWLDLLDQAYPIRVQDQE